MTVDPQMSNLIALLMGVVIGILIALPWRPIIRRRVASHDIAVLSKQLHTAIAELDSMGADDREPFSGGGIRSVV